HAQAVEGPGEGKDLFGHAVGLTDGDPGEDGVEDDSLDGIGVDNVLELLEALGGKHVQAGGAAAVNKGLVLEQGQRLVGEMGGEVEAQGFREDAQVVRDHGTQVEAAFVLPQSLADELK